MKEITSVLTVQFTYIGLFDDTEAERILATKEEREKAWMEQVKVDAWEADDIKLISSKVFTLDKESNHERG